MATRARRETIVDGLGLLAIALVLLDLFRPSLLLLPTIAAGGDTPCHYPTAAWLIDHLLPEGRLHGWYPGAYLGHPLLLYYFPLPFLLMAAMAPLVGLPVAFKLGTVLGVFLLPLLVYASLRLMGLSFPAPLLGAATALVFLFVEDNPIWGGTIASTLAGEFAYTYGVGLAVLFVGVAHRAHTRGDGPWAPAVALGLTAWAHGYAVLWAGFTATGLLALSPRPWRTLRWLLQVAALAFGFAAPLLIPLLGDWGWTTPYDDAWITVSTTGLLPPLLLPPLAMGVAGVALTILRPPSGRRDSRLLLLAHGTLVGIAFAAAGPALGVIDVRFVPCAQLSLALAGAAALGLVLSRLARPDLAALGLTALGIVHAQATSHVVRSWVDWNDSGLEAKELWPAWRALTEHLRGGVGDPRVAVEYSPIHEKAGSIRMYETLPFFSGRSTLEGVYNQASVMTHPVYYLASELFAHAPNPFRSRSYSRFDPETALERLRLFDVGAVVAVSDELKAALRARADVVEDARIPPYTVYRVRDPGPGYAEPLAFEPVRAPRAGWRDNAYRWMTRKPPNRALLVFTDDPRFELRQRDPWAPPEERALPAGVTVETEMGDEEIRVRTSRPGHPILVKVSYHPRWRAEGADGPFLVSPGLMLVIPRRADVRLVYAGRTWADWLGLGLFVAAAGGGVAAWRRREARRCGAAEVPIAPGASTLGEWILRSLPLLALLALAATRLLPPPSPPITADDLDARASRAFSAGRWEDAAEYARHAVERLGSASSRRAEMLCVRGEALLRAGHAREAARAFAVVISEAPGDPHRGQALYSGARARAEAGDGLGAAQWRGLLRRELPDSPWTGRLAADEAASAGEEP